ncbi:hypothetical protein Poli38472_005749 [Pythium oligandrum]|uniref:TIR domain-containing protein n=1 Tax=Pythium oligandrum TaxID=41045 RepID=A0A8K1FMI4_PYTOL|nr:hypothetical protein Poli38472_005749 [Pythium oligandrum]|eukprot:TMW68281.1 hypothetical protein Poli38472_005749 [Pythium oligandrum]
MGHSHYGATPDSTHGALLMPTQGPHVHGSSALLTTLPAPVEASTRRLSVASSAPAKSPTHQDAKPWKSWWPGLDKQFQLTNTYYAKRMAIVTLLSYVAVFLLRMVSDLKEGDWIWLSFHIINTLLGVSALPCFHLYSVEDPKKKDPPSTMERTSSNLTEGEMEQKRPSFSFLRSSFHVVESKLEALVLKRSVILRVCETLVVVQSVLLLFLAFVVITALWTSQDNIWTSSKFSTGSAFGVLAGVCVFLQTREFDHLREHQQLQLGAGLDQEELSMVHGNHKLKRPSGSYLSTTSSLTQEDVEASLQSVRSIRSPVEIIFEGDATIDLGHSAAMVEYEFRRGLYEAAVDRDHDKARSLLQVMERAVGSRAKLEILLTRMYSTPTLWLWWFAFSTYNPLHIACRLGDLEMVELLLEFGLNPNLLDKIAGAPLSLRLLYECCQGRARNVTNVLGAPLHLAVEHGHTHVIDVLVQRHANIDELARTSFFSRSMRVSPIFLADAADVVECLVRHRANILLVPGKGNSMTVTVLQCALLQDRAELAAVLEEWGADVALTPLHEAAATGDRPKVAHYLSWGIEPDQKGEFQTGVNNRTPLHWASVMGRRIVVEELIRHRANVNAQDSRGRTPLHWAARHNHVSTVEALLEAGADPRVVDESGLTPLGFGSAGGLVGRDCVALFVRHGVNVNDWLFNEAGDTCLHLALRRGHRETAIALIEAGDADLSSVNSIGRRAVECCTSAEIQFAVKMSSQWIDIVISYEPVYRAFAERVKQGIEQHHVTVFMRDRFEGAEGSMQFMETASAVICVLSPGYEHDGVCKQELAFAKENQVPVMAISTEAMDLSEELQVYLFTRQIVPFQACIISTSKTYVYSQSGDGTSTHPMSPSGSRELVFSINEDKFKTSLQSLIDGVRDEVELHRLGDPQTEDDLLQSDLRDTSGNPIGTGSESATSSPRPSSLASSSRRGTASERGLMQSNRNVVPTSPRVARLTRSETFHRRTMDDVVRDVIVRQRQRAFGWSSAAPTSLSVFLSHGDCHKDFVLKLYRELRRHQVPVTLDSMSTVSSMKDRILAAKDAILQSSVFLVVLSSQSVKTELVSDQLAFAEDKGKCIVPIYYTRKPSVVDEPVRSLLDQSSLQRMLIFADDVGYGRGVEELVRDLRAEEQRITRESNGTEVRRSSASSRSEETAEAVARMMLQKARASVGERVSFV